MARQREDGVALVGGRGWTLQQLQQLQQLQLKQFAIVNLGAPR